MIRKVLPADLQAVVALDGSSFDEPYEAAFLARACADPAYAFLVCTEDERLVGYVLAQRSDAYELMRIAVVADRRRRGIGKELLDKLSDRPVALEVAGSNATALAFYQGCGFVLARVRKDYYGAGRDALVCIRPPL